MILHGARGRLAGEIAGEIVEWTVGMILRDSVGCTEREREGVSLGGKKEEESACGFVPARFRAV